ncbi:MAG: acetyl-CoA decarbonylase/synthase complex subunit gamma, partial [Deltaproteobacteria bacterium]|nr:acetyl-CoA decarbonylase/synthase complex subunit gamma [Deltaproteobacteria bacterium]
SAEASAALGAASAPPIRGVTVGQGARAVSVGEETVFFRHEKTFVRRPGLFRRLEARGRAAAEVAAMLDSWAALRLERAGEPFQVDGVVLASSDGVETASAAVAAASTRGLPVALLADTPEGAAAIFEPIKAQRPLLVPPFGADPAPWIAAARRLAVPLVVSGADLDALAGAAADAARAGVSDLLLEPPGTDAREVHRSLSLIRRGALDRLHPGLAYPVFLRVGAGDLERAILGIAKFASLVALTDAGGETWLPLWTLRQNIYTDPQKPLQMDARVYPVGEPDARAPLVVTTNFSLTYFIVSTELDGAGVPSHLAVVDTEGMSVLTAWAAGKFSGERVAKALREMGATERVGHQTVIIPGYAAAISGELEDALGPGWRVLTGPQEASDLAPFLRDVWAAVAPAGSGA